MNFLKKIIESLTYAISAKLIEYIFSSAFIGLIVFPFLFMRESFEKLFLLNIGLIMFLSFSGWLLALIFGTFLYLRSSPPKKLINQIYVDSKGACFCPSCTKPIAVVPKPEEKWKNIFYCRACNHLPRAYMTSGTFIPPYEFLSIQAENPQTIVTPELFRERQKKAMEKQMPFKTS